jgi:hypothetical protein
MYPDCCVEIAVRCSHDGSRGRSGRESTNVDALCINRIVAHDLTSDARDKRRFTSPPFLAAINLVVPAPTSAYLAYGFPGQPKSHQDDIVWSAAPGRYSVEGRSIKRPAKPKSGAT